MNNYQIILRYARGSNLPLMNSSSTFAPSGGPFILILTFIGAFILASSNYILFISFYPWIS